MVIRVPTINLQQPLDGLLEAIALGWDTESAVLDFSQCRFLTAESVILLAGLTHVRVTRGLATRVQRDSLAPHVARNLAKMGFLTIFDGSPPPQPQNSLPLYRQREYDKLGIIRYIHEQIMTRPQMPAMSPSLAKEIRRSFAEVFGNVFHHSDSPIGGLVCGQVYPRVREIELTFYDGGVGIAHKVRAHIKGVDDDATAIGWALQRGTSTAAIEGGHPRGLGLYLIREFLRVNGGNLHVLANNGYYFEAARGRRADELQSGLPGTLIDLRIKVREGVSYRFADETT